MPLSCASINSCTVALRFIPFISLIAGFFDEETEEDDDVPGGGTDVDEDEDEDEDDTFFLSGQSFISGNT